MTSTLDHAETPTLDDVTCTFGTATSDQQRDSLAVLAHELRNPLAAIRSAFYLLQLDGHDAATRELVESVLDQQTQQMGRLIEDLLDVARICQGKIELHKQPVKVVEIINRAIGTVWHAVEERDQVLEVALTEESLTLHADPTRLEQVLVNLLSNAVKYTDPGGRILLSAGQEWDEVVLRVRDNGIGIAPTALSRVFDLFWQSPGEADHSNGGLGIGLALVRQLVELHGGSVSVSSDGIAQGSEFVVRLPGLAAEIESSGCH